MTLVEIRHGRCRELLYEVSEPPDDWAGTLDVPNCRRCNIGVPAPRRFARWARGRGAKPLATVSLRVRWEDLRPAVEQALASGRVQQETV